MAQSSFAYRTTTGNEVVPNGGTIVLPYPKADADSGHVNQSEAEVVVGNQSWKDGEGQVDVEFDGDPNYTITVTNGTGADWPPQTDVVVTCPADLNLAGAEAVADVLRDHEARIAALEAAAGVERSKPERAAKEPAKNGKNGKHAKKGR